MSHSGWHRATVPQGLQNMLNRLVPQSCKDMNTRMNSFTCTHCPASSIEFLRLRWLKSPSGFFGLRGLKGVRKQGVFSRLPASLWPAHYIYFF